MSHHRLVVLALLALAPGCASRRLLVVENQLLRQQVTELQTRVAQLEQDLPNPDDFVRKVDLAAVHDFLQRAGYAHTWTEGARFIRLEFTGRNTSFAVTIQHFAERNVLFLATSNLLHLEDAQSTESVVLLLVQMAAINYDLLVGKFQLNPETGEILLSAELRINDGLGYRTFIEALDQLCATADDRHPELERAIEGLGL